MAQNQPEPQDPWYARLAFEILKGRGGPWWITLWLVLILGSLVALGVVAGPWLPGAISAVTALTAGGAAISRHRIRQPPNGP